MSDYLREYTLMDTVSFLEALQFYSELIRDKLDQNITDFYTLPGMSEAFFYAKASPGIIWLPRKLSKFSNERTDLDLMLYRDLKQDALGGLSCTYNRVGIRGVTVANPLAEKRLSQGCVEGFDFVRFVKL